MKWSCVCPPVFSSVCLSHPAAACHSRGFAAVGPVARLLHSQQAATPFHSILKPEIQHSRTAAVYANHSERNSINQSRIFRVVHVMKSLQGPLEVGNNLPGINDNVRE